MNLHIHFSYIYGVFIKIKYVIQAKVKWTETFKSISVEINERDIFFRKEDTWLSQQATCPIKSHLFPDIPLTLLFK